jgi:hypothetical protein
MPDDTDDTDDADDLVRRLVAGDGTAHDRILDAARSGDSPTVLVAAALVTGDRDLVDRAAASGVTTRDRQLAAIAAAHLDDDEDRFDALVRDHLSDHPDSLLAAWIAAGRTRPASPRTTPPRSRHA